MLGAKIFVAEVAFAREPPRLSSGRRRMSGDRSHVSQRWPARMARPVLYPVPCPIHQSTPLLLPHSNLEILWRRAKRYDVAAEWQLRD